MLIIVLFHLGGEVPNKTNKKYLSFRVGIKAYLQGHTYKSHTVIRLLNT